MHNDNLLIFKNSGILFLRLVITSLLGLFTTRIIVQGLGPSDYGLYSVVGGVVVMMAFLNTVMISTSFRYIAYEMGKGNTKGVNQVFNISLVIHFGMAFIILILTETLGVFYIQNYLNVNPDKVSDALFVLRFSSYAMIFSVISIPFQGLVTALENFTFRALVEITRSLLMLSVVIIVFYYTGNKLRLYALLMAVISIIPAFMFFSYCKKKQSKIVKWNFQKEKGQYAEMFSFSIWIAFGAAASVGQAQGSALILNNFFGTVINAAFGIANQLNTLVKMIAGNLGQATVPQITKSFSSGDTDRSIKLVAYISKYSFFIMLFPALPLLLETNYFLTLWIGELPPYTIIFSQLMIINALIDSLGGGIPAIVQATGKIKYFQIVLSISSLLSLPIAYLLFKSGFSPSSLLVAFISTAVLNVILRQILLKYLLNFNVIYFLKTSYLKAFYVLILIVPLFFLRDIFEPGFLRVVFFSILTICWLCIAIYFTGVEKKERNLFKKLLKELIYK